MYEPRDEAMLPIEATISNTDQRTARSYVLLRLNDVGMNRSKMPAQRAAGSTLRARDHRLAEPHRVLDWCAMLGEYDAL